MPKKKYQSHIQFSKRGGIARAKKYSKEQLSAWAKKGGRPKTKKNHESKEN